MVNSKLSRKSLKSRSLKLKNKRTKKIKVSKKNVKNMRGGLIKTIDEAQKRLQTIKSLGKNYIKILNLNTDIEGDFILIDGKLTEAILTQKKEKLMLYYHPREYRLTEFQSIMHECFQIINDIFDDLFLNLQRPLNRYSNTKHASASNSGYPILENKKSMHQKTIRSLKRQEGEYDKIANPIYHNIVEYLVKEREKIKTKGEIPNFIKKMTSQLRKMIKEKMLDEKFVSLANQSLLKATNDDYELGVIETVEENIIKILDIMEQEMLISINN